MIFIGVFFCLNMSKRKEVAKFSPLNDERIGEIISGCDHISDRLSAIAAKADNLKESEKYRHLFSGEITATFIKENLQVIAEFLRDCRLIGAAQEGGQVENWNYVIGADGVEILNQYMATKPNNKNGLLHNVVVVKNENLRTSGGSVKAADILIEQNGVHDGFAKKLTKDLADNKDDDFNRTYLIETFGTTGGNHFVCVTIRKNPDENSPIIDFFDTSPALLRGDLEFCQNYVASGWLGAITINATLVKALKDSGLEFEQNKFHYNSEPLQAKGNSNCSIFSYEKAYFDAKMTREQHEEVLKTFYRYPSEENPISSIYGGKTEVPIDFDKVLQDKKVIAPQLGLPPYFMHLSHFKSHIESAYVNEMKMISHHQKNNQKESLKERWERYSGAEKESLGSLVEQKSLRQKYGHLLEIVRNKQFLDLKERPACEIEDFPENAKSVYASRGEMDSEIEEIFLDLNKFFFSPIRVHQISRCAEDEQNCEAMFYMGGITAQRVKKWAEEKGIELEINHQKLDGIELVGFDERICEREQVILKVKVEELAKIMKKEIEEGRFINSYNAASINATSTCPVLTNQAQVRL